MWCDAKVDKIIYFNVYIFQISQHLVGRLHLKEEATDYAARHHYLHQENLHGFPEVDLACK